VRKRSGLWLIRLVKRSNSMFKLCFNMYFFFSINKVSFPIAIKRTFICDRGNTTTKGSIRQNNPDITK
jgi:hypothetical protein